MERQEIIALIDKFTATFGVLCEGRLRQPVLSLAPLRFGDGVGRQPEPHIVGLGKRKELRGSLVVVVVGGERRARRHLNL